MFKSFEVLALGVALALSNLVFAADQSVVDAYSTMHALNQIEISAGNQIQKSGSDVEAVAFGRSMAAHHTQADAKLTAFATEKRITLTEAKDMESEDLAAVSADANKLATLTGAALDKAFASVMVKVHALALSEIYTSQLRFRATPEGRFLADMIPELRTHYDLSVKIAERLHD